MGFTTSCFIRKNTPELRKKLEKLGYMSMFSNANGICLATAAYIENYFSISEGLFNDKHPYRTYDYAGRGKSSVSCPLKPSDSAPLKHSTMPP